MCHGIACVLQLSMNTLQFLRKEMAPNVALSIACVAGSTRTSLNDSFQLTQARIMNRKPICSISTQMKLMEQIVYTLTFTTLI